MMMVWRNRNIVVPLYCFFVPQISQIYTDFSWDVFKSRRFRRWRRFFSSSDDTEFIRRFPAATITHGFSQRRPVRSLQIPPEVVKSPTDFTDIHRFFLGRFLVTQISQMTQIFFIIGRHGISRRRPVRSLQISPWDRTKRFHKKICGNLWNLWDKKTPTKKICVICEICVTKNVPQKIMKQNPPRKTCETKEQREGEPRQLFLLGSQTNIEITQLSWRYA